LAGILFDHSLRVAGGYRADWIKASCLKARAAKRRTVIREKFERGSQGTQDAEIYRAGWY